MPPWWQKSKPPTKRLPEAFLPTKNPAPAGFFSLGGSNRRMDFNPLLSLHYQFAVSQDLLYGLRCPPSGVVTRSAPHFDAFRREVGFQFADVDAAFVEDAGGERAINVGVQKGVAEVFFGTGAA